MYAARRALREATVCGANLLLCLYEFGLALSIFPTNYLFITGGYKYAQWKILWAPWLFCFALRYLVPMSLPCVCVCVLLDSARSTPFLHFEHRSFSTPPPPNIYTLYIYIYIYIYILYMCVYIYKRKKEKKNETKNTPLHFYGIFLTRCKEKWTNNSPSRHCPFMLCYSRIRDPVDIGLQRVRMRRRSPWWALARTTQCSKGRKGMVS